MMLGVKSGKGVASSPTHVVVANEKGAFGLPSTAVGYLTFLNLSPNFIWLPYFNNGL